MAKVYGRKYSLVARYIRSGATDSAFEMYQFEMDRIAHEHMTRHQRIVAQNEAYRRFKGNAILSTPLTSKNKSRETWLRRNPGKSIADWVKAVDEIKSFRAANNFFKGLDSKEVEDILYNIDDDLTLSEKIDKLDNVYNDILNERGYKTESYIKAMLRESL